MSLPTNNKPGFIFFKSAPKYTDQTGGTMESKQPSTTDISPDSTQQITQEPLATQQITREPLNTESSSESVTNIMPKSSEITNDLPSTTESVSGGESGPAELESGITETEQIEDTVMLYIKLLDPADKYLLQYQSIYDNGEKYISYLKSPEYLQYRKARRTFYGKYSNNKKFSVTVTKKKVTAFTRDKNGQPGSQTDMLLRPTYINIADVLEKAHKTLKQTRIKLDNEYSRLLDKPFISAESKARFIRSRETLIRKVNEYYSLQYYYHKINGMIQANKMIALPIVSSYYSEDAQDILPRITTKEISISTDEISQQYTNDTNKLELYNKIKSLMLDLKRDSPLTKELKELIQSYITFDETNNTELLSLIERKKKHNQLEYLVIPPGLEMPENSLIKPADLRPFYASKNRVKST